MTYIQLGVSKEKNIASSLSVFEKAKLVVSHFLEQQGTNVITFLNISQATAPINL